MDKTTNAGLFVNDGSFLEKFKQLQQEKEKKNEIPNKSKAVPSPLLNSSPKTVISKTSMELKSNSIQKTFKTPSSGKLAFSLKQKSKLVAPAVKLGEDEDEDDVRNKSDDVPMKRQKLGQPDASYRSPKKVDDAPPFPSDPTVRKVADKLASFVAKNGRQFEDVTRQKNPGETPFKFLFDESSSDFKYYEYKLREEQKVLSESRDSQPKPNVGYVGNVGTAAPSTTSSFQASFHQQHSKYQTPASALYEAPEGTGSSGASLQTSGRYGESSTPTGSDPIAMMEYYMKKAAAEEKRRPPKASKDEMPPPASLQAPVEKGHHMGDFIPLEELEKFFATCNDASAQKAWKEMADKTKIQADNVGHKLLSKMGWREGEGLGSSKSGISAPIRSGEVKKDHLGVGAHAPGEVTPDDDIYEQYKKRMMLGYRHRPNPLNNPRKSYY